MDDDFGELWPGVVGITCDVPYVETEVGLRLLGLSGRPRFANELEQCARQLHQPARAVLQDEKTDHYGAPQAAVVLWCEPEVDIAAMRQHLHANGYSVSMAAYYYTPAIA